MTDKFIIEIEFKKYIFPQTLIEFEEHMKKYGNVELLRLKKIKEE